MNVDNRLQFAFAISVVDYKFNWMIQMSKQFLVLLLMGYSSLAYSEGSPWLPGDGTTKLGLSFTSGATEDFFIGETSTDLGGELSGTFIWLDASYGYDDIWAFDVRTGYAEGEFESNPEVESDITDTSFGVSYQFLNEFEADNGLPTISGRIGYTFGGDYDPNRVDAIGDGASGFDISLLVGKSVTPSIAAFADLTYRQRDSDVSDAIKLLLSGYYTSPIPGLGFQVSYALVRSDSDLDFGDPDVGIERFSETNRDTDWIITGVNYTFNNSGIGIGLSYAALLDGRNIPDSDIGTASLSYAF